MLGLFKRPGGAPVDTSRLGASAVAMVVPGGSAIASGCTAVLIDQGGHARRVQGPARLAPAPNETAWLFRPGPWQFDLRPFDAAAEIGLRLRFVIDAADPRASQQRFDLYLASEAAGVPVLEAAVLFADIEGAVQRELAQGHLDLPPCTSLAEWNAFRQGLDRLLYVRFGLTVDECLPVDLGDSVDFAALLKNRVAVDVAPIAQAPSLPTPAAAPVEDGSADAIALRRLFLELPCLMLALRVAVLPRGQEQFQAHQALLRRLDMVSLSVTTMPSLRMAAPGVPLESAEVRRRMVHSRRACTCLDEAWALLARLRGQDEGAEATFATLLADAGRIVANLEHDVAGRRASVEEGA